MPAPEGYSDDDLLYITIDMPFADRLATYREKAAVILEDPIVQIPANPLGGLLVEGWYTARRIATLGNAVVHGAVHISSHKETP